MSTLDLRPLTLGELLDRTFTLYRAHFLLFVGISAIPQVLILALQLVPALFVGLSMKGIFSVPTNPNGPPQLPSFPTAAIVGVVLFAVLWIVVVVIASLLTQGATVVAVSEIYLGRATTLAAAFRPVWKKLITIFLVAVLTGFAMIGGFILLIVPGIYIACRLSAGVQAAVLENTGAIDALSRSFALTKDNAGRVFLIYLLYCCLLGGAIGALYFVIGIPLALGAILAKNNPAIMWIIQILPPLGSFVAGSLAAPLLTIAMSIFYYDMRVKKEGFDLQMMMNPLGGAAVPAASVPPAMLS
jgi:hypothetical protein